MSWITRLRAAFWKGELEENLDAELQFHLEMRTRDFIAAGMQPEAARRRAMQLFGNQTLLKERTRDMDTLAWMETLAQDLRYAVRILRKSPGFATIAVLSLALGIGANTAVFSMLNTLLLTKLPVRDPNGLYQLLVTHRSATHNSFSYTDYRKLHDGFDIFDGVIAWTASNFQIEVNNAPLEVHGALVTGTFYDVLGVKPALGRLIADADDTATGSSGAVLGYSFWERVFGRDPNVIGKVFRVEGTPFTVIGVTPREFSGTEVDYPRDVTLPVNAVKRIWPKNKLLEQTGNYWLRVMVRLKPGTTMKSARPVLRDLWPKLLEADGSRPIDGWTQKLNIEPGSMGVSNVRNEFSDALGILMTLVALVLLIACANISNLLLARAAGRRKEIGVRVALGASRNRLVRQWLTESLVLTGIGGCTGIMLAHWMAQVLLLFLPKGDAGFLEFHLDVRMLLFAAALTSATTLLVGVLPSIQAANLPPGSAMNESARGSSGGRRAWLTRGVVVAQVAICLVLVTGALLFTHSLQNLARSDYGFQRDGLLLVHTNPAKGGFKGDRGSLFFREFLARLNATPGISLASCAFITPLSGGMWWDPAVVPGYVPAQNEMTTIYLNSVSPRYFATMGTPVLEGREFTDADDKSSRPVAVVNESFARRFFHGDALGRKFTVGDGNENEQGTANLEVVGVVANTKYGEPREKQKELVYIAMYQGKIGVSGTIQVRLAPGIRSDSASAEIRKIAGEVGKDVPVEVQPYNDLFRRVLQQDRMVALLSAFFGFLGMTLAFIGLYGVLACAVNARRGEIGIRMALGARRASVIWMILRESLLLASLGAAIGIPVSISASRFVGSYLFGLKPSDPVALVLSTLAILTVAMLAGYLPGRRASSVDPMMTLRSE
jgi:predicted permease